MVKVRRLSNELAIDNPEQLFCSIGLTNQELHSLAKTILRNGTSAHDQGSIIEDDNYSDHSRNNDLCIRA